MRTKKQFDKSRYNLHYRLRKRDEKERGKLNVHTRIFSDEVSSPEAKKLINDFGYCVQNKLFE